MTSTGEHGFDSKTHPFGWFTQTGNLPLDSNPDIIWVLESGRYFGHRLSTGRKEPFVEPQLITTGTADLAVANAKQELGRQKRRITGNPYTRWNDQLHSGSLSQSAARPRSSVAAQSQNPPSNQVPASVARQTLPAYNPGPSMASFSVPPIGQSSTAPLIYPPNNVPNPSDHSNRMDGNSQVLPSSYIDTNNGDRPSDTNSVPGGDCDPCKLRGGDGPVQR